MRKSQTYLGIPDAIVLCIDEYGTDIKGRKYDTWHLEAIPFTDVMDMLKKMEELYDSLRFPFPGNNERHFVTEGKQEMKEELNKQLSDEEVLGQHGDQGTFIVRVQHRQNSSWQGRITWVEEDKTVYFRSVWEMMKLMDEALNENKDSDPSWKK